LRDGTEKLSTLFDVMYYSPKPVARVEDPSH